MSYTDLSASFLLSIGSALVVSIGARKALLSIKSQSPLIKGLLLITPYLGVTVSGSVNLAFCRYKDLLYGISVIGLVFIFKREKKLICKIRS